MSISEKLKQARAKSELTQEVIAEKVGVSRQTIYSWESGKSYPDIASLMILSDVYGVTLDSLLKGDADMIQHLEEGFGKGKRVKYVIVSVLALMVVMFSIWASFATLGASLIYFVNGPTFILLLLPLIFVLTITRGYNLFYLGLRALIFPKMQISDEHREQAVSLFRLMSKTIAITAIIFTITGVASMLVGAALAEADYFRDLYNTYRNIVTILLIPLYSLIMIVVIFEPVVFILKKR